MPQGPRGEKRPADVIGNAVKLMRIATGGRPAKDTAEGGLAQPRREAALSAGRARSAQGLDRAQKVIDAATCSSFFSRQNRKE